MFTSPQVLWCWHSPEPLQYFYPLNPSRVHTPLNPSSVHIPQPIGVCTAGECSTMGLATSDLTTLKVI